MQYFIADSHVDRWFLQEDLSNCNVENYYTVVEFEINNLRNWTRGAGIKMWNTSILNNLEIYKVSQFMG